MSLLRARTEIQGSAVKKRVARSFAVRTCRCFEHLVGNFVDDRLFYILVARDGGIAHCNVPPTAMAVAPPLCTLARGGTMMADNLQWSIAELQLQNIYVEITISKRAA
jgi:hypothetical protein